MLKVKCSNIRWDTSDGDENPTPDECGLPQECTLDTDLSADELKTGLADILSDKFGFCVFGFDFEVLGSS